MDLGGNPLVGEPPKFAKGAVVSPCSDSIDAQLAKMERKVLAGCDYFQTQAVFEPEKFIAFMERARQFFDRGRVEYENLRLCTCHDLRQFCRRRTDSSAARQVCQFRNCRKIIVQIAQDICPSVQVKKCRRSGLRPGLETWKVRSKKREEQFMKGSIYKKIFAALLVVSLFATAAPPGILASDTVYAAEKSVESIEVVKNPDKITYFSVRDRTIDLCGMELSIQYTDGTADTISINEHTDTFEADNGTIESSLIGGYADRELLITYGNEQCTIPLQKPDFKTAAPAEIKDEGNYSTIVTEEQPYCIYSFCPSETKTYHFFSYSETSVKNYAELYEGNNLIAENGDGGDNKQFRLSEELSAGKNYYFVVSHRNFGTKGEFTCCLSSAISSISELEVQKLEVTKASKDTWYDFETDPIPVKELSIAGTEYKVTYNNGWERTGTITADVGSGYEAELFGKTLSARWKYTTTDESGNSYADKDKADNALIYTYDGQPESEFPVQFHAPGPVASIDIVSSPWKDWKPYQYQVQAGKRIIWPLGQISVKIQYNDGRNEETVTWDQIPQGDLWKKHNEYDIRGDLKDRDNIQPGTGNAVVVSYMGKSAEIPITVKEDPIESIQILQEPEKTEFYPFEESADLYGMKVQIAYKDGKTQTVEATEHTAALTVPDTEGYGGELTSSLDPSKTVSVSYMGYTIEHAFGAERRFTAEDSIQLTAEEEKQTVVDEGASYLIFSFTPSESAVYRFKCDNYNTIRIYDAANIELYDTWGNSLDYGMFGGRSYYIAMLYEGGGKQNITYSICRQADIPIEEISEISLLVDEPSAGEALPDLTEIESDQYYISDCSWLNDENDDKIADFGKKHQFRAVLRAKDAHQFTASTEVAVNGENITEKSVGSDGDLTICYTFPSYTQFQITVPQAEGYTLDESQNPVPGRGGYGESYTFRYIKNTGNDSSRLVVKARDAVLAPDGDGTYVIENITQNITVTVKKQMYPPITPAKASQELRSKYDSNGKRLEVKVGSRLTQVVTGARTNVTFSSSNSKIAKVGKTSGAIRFVRAGKVVITAKAAETQEYKAASKKTTFYVIPKTASVKSLKSNKKGQVTIKGSNGEKDNDGYQFQYKHNGKTRKVRVKGRKSVTKTIKKLKSGKSFKVRMRAYKKVGGVTYYGKYGKWKTLKKVK